MGMPMAKCGAVEHVVRFLGARAAVGPEQLVAINSACGFPCAERGWGFVCGNFSAGCMSELHKVLT